MVIFLRYQNYSNKQYEEHFCEIILNCDMPPDKSVYLKIIFIIFQPKHMLWVLKRTVSMRRFLFKFMGKEIKAILGAQTILIWADDVTSEWFMKCDHFVQWSGTFLQF